MISPSFAKLLRFTDTKGLFKPVPRKIQKMAAKVIKEIMHPEVIESSCRGFLGYKSNHDARAGIRNRRHPNTYL